MMFFGNTSTVVIHNHSDFTFKRTNTFTDRGNTIETNLPPTIERGTYTSVLHACGAW